MERYFLRGKDNLYYTTKTVNMPDGNIFVIAYPIPHSRIPDDVEIEHEDEVQIDAFGQVTFIGDDGVEFEAATSESRTSSTRLKQMLENLKHPCKDTTTVNDILSLIRARQEQSQNMLFEFNPKHLQNLNWDDDFEEIVKLLK